MQKIAPETYSSISKFWRNAIFIVFMAFLAGCDSFCGTVMDCGCIEADDFGEFQQQILTVQANAQSTSCNYDSSKEIDDNAQGAGLSKCFKIDATSIESNGITKNSSNGCLGFNDSNGGPVYRQKCIAECVNKCKVANMSASGSSEPSWLLTSKTFTISPFQEIAITAIGNITLSEAPPVSTVFVKPNEFGFHSLKITDSSNLPNDVAAGGQKKFVVQGMWKDAVDSANNSVVNIGPGSINYKLSSNTNEALAQVYNGFRRLVAYVEEAPAGYESSSTDDKASIRGLPFYPDYSLWRCTYKGANELEYNCESADYRTSGYTNMATSVNWDKYKIGAAKAANLGTIGGIIRWDTDNLTSFDSPNTPFKKNDGSSIVCNSSHNCTPAGADYINNLAKGVMIGKSLQGTTVDNGFHLYTNNNDYPVTVSFANLSTDDSCNRGDLMGVKHLNSGDVAVYPTRDARVDINANWSSGENLFYLEKGDKLRMYDVSKTSAGGGLEVTATVANSSTTKIATITKNTISGAIDINTILATAFASGSVTYSITKGNEAGYFVINANDGNIRATAAGVAHFGSDNAKLVKAIDGDPSGTNCAEFIGYRIDKVHEITINKSGLISFAMLGEANSGGSCTLNTRIVNPLGSRFADLSNNLEQDFYEYGEASEGLDSAASTITVGASNSALGATWSSDKIFVRKGQVLRFSPKSWNGTWIAGAGKNRKCGIGMAMKIEPRLALLCRGKANETVSNPLCKIDVASATPKCKAYADECYDKTNSSYYCPIDADIASSMNPQAKCIWNASATTKCSGAASGNTCSSKITQATCEAATDANSNATTYVNCQVATGYYNSAKCNQAADADRGVVEVNSATCLNCYNKAQANAALAVTKTMELDQCYNLESYTGKVGNIPKDSSAIKPKVVSNGAAKIKVFDGILGNFEDFAYQAQDSATSNAIYNTSTFSFGVKGRLKFVILDGEDFNKSTTAGVKAGYDSYADNATTAAFTGDNGFKVDVSGEEQFFNGALMEVKLCKDAKTSSGSFPGTCDSVPEITTQPYVVKIGNPAISGGVINYISYYKINDFGRLVRINNPNATGAFPASGAFNCITTAPALGTNCAGGVCNGFITENSFYIPSPNNTGKICAANEKIGPASTAGACQKQKFCGSSNYVSVGSEFYIHSETQDVENIRLAFRIKDTDVPNCRTSAPVLNDPCSGGVCDGVVMKNPFYLPSTSSNTGAICSAGQTIGADSDKCQKEKYCGNVYANNTGSYKVSVQIKNKDGSSISSVVDSVVQPIVELMDGTEEGVEPRKAGQAERIYKLVIANSTFIVMSKIILVLSVTFYGIGFLMGISQFTHTEIVSRVIKIAIIYLFISPQGWEWFDRIFVQFFKEGTDYLSFLMATSFDTSPKLEQALANNDFYDKSVLFASVDNVFGIFFSDSAQKKIASLLFASIFGWAYMVIIYMSFLLYVYAVANAVLLYLTSQVFISILFVLAPLFFLFLFFNQTKEMFDKWLSQLIGFSLQQIFLLTTLAFFNMMMYEILKMALGFKICWDDILVIKKPIRIVLLSFWTPASFPPRLNSQTPVGNVGANSGLPSLFTILFIWVVASLMKQFIAFMTDLAASIGGGVKASSMGAGIHATVSKAATSMGKMVEKNIWNDQLKGTVQRMDEKLFDSGDQADKNREKRIEKNRMDNKHKKAMKESGENAVKDYKRKNATELAAMTKEEQQKTLNGVRDRAMTETGKGLGLDADTIKKLKDDKGYKIESDTLAGAAFEIAKQKMRSDTTKKSLGEQDAESKFTRDDIKQALRNTDDKGRKEITGAIEKGAIGVEKKKTQQALDYVKKAGPIGSALETISGANTERKEFNRAKDELEKEGKIDRMRTGTGWSRSEQDKNEIKQRMQKNIADSKIGMDVNRDEEIIFARQQEGIAAKLASGKESHSTRDKKSVAATLLGQERTMIGALERSKERDRIAAALRQERVAGTSTKANAVKEELSSVEDKKATAQESLDSSLTQINKSLENPDHPAAKVAAAQQEKEGLGWKRHIPGTAAYARAKELNKEIRTNKATPEYIQFLDANRSAHEQQSTVSNLEAQEQSLTKIDKQADWDKYHARIAANNAMPTPARALPTPPSLPSPPVPSAPSLPTTPRMPLPPVPSAPSPPPSSPLPPVPSAPSPPPSSPLPPVPSAPSPPPTPRVPSPDEEDKT